MFQNELNSQLINAQKQIKTLKDELSKITDEEINAINKYQDLINDKEFAPAKKKKTIEHKKPKPK